MATINNSSSDTIIVGTNSNDIISNGGENVTILAQGGNDYIHNDGSNVTIDGGNDNDVIDNWSPNVTIFGGESNDTITNTNDAHENSISSGVGDDIISLRTPGGTFTINGGTGNDTVYWDESNNPTVFYQYTKGDGNDVIYYFNETSKLQISGTNTYSTQVSGNDVLVKVGINTITLKNVLALTDSILINDETINLDRKTIKLADGGDTVTISRGYLSVIGGNGDDYIQSSRGKFVVINGGYGNDSINSNSRHGTINGGAGDDSISNHTHDVILSGGSGKDSIWNNAGDYVTISGDKDNDFIQNHGSNALFVYKAGDGFDTITGFNSTDTLTISGSSYSTQESGYDLLVKVGSGRITVKDAYAMTDYVSINEQKINLIRKDIKLADRGDKVTISRGYLSVIGGNGDDDIHNNKSSSSVSIDSGAGNDKIGNLGSDVIINSGVGDDSIHNNGGNVTINAGAGNDYVYNYTWINSPVIINTGEGDDYIENNGSQVTINTGKGNDTIENDEDNVYINGGAGDDYISLDGGKSNIFYNAGDGFDTVYGVTSNDTINIFGAIYTRSTIKNDVVIEVGDGSILLKDAATLSSVNIVDQKNVTIDDTTTSPTTLDATTEIADASERTTKIQITGNNLDNSIVGGKKNDTLYGAGGDDTLTGGNGKNVFVHDSGNDVITDYKEKKDKINVDADYQSYELYGDDLILNYGDNNSLTIQDGANKVINTVQNKKKVANVYAGYGVLDGKKKLMTPFPGLDVFDATSDKIYSKVVTIDAAAAENEIYILGNKKKNRIIAGDKGSTLDGGKGKDTLVGGAGADVFIYNNEDGKDIIENYGANDKIFLVNDLEIKDVKVKKDSTVIKVKGGSLTVKGTSEFTFMGGGEDTIFSGGIFIGNYAAKVYNSFNGTIELSPYDAAIADATLAKKPVTINGGTLYDSLVGGKGKDKIYGNAGNDTLIGGKGNDSLWGGEDSDIFVYNAGDGKDIIYGFEDDDMLRISSTFSASYNERKEEISINVGSTSKAITLKDFSAASFNINGTNYKISGNTLTN